MGQALYRKYRSKKLSEIVGQEHITDTLERAIKAGKLSHAYLFTGPKGVGKTSIARILAHEVNDLPYTDESIHLDIIEIDAASNRRIDEIRDLRDKVHIAPTSAKYKVYIIDEVHMLTKEAFNALLKTLEEPPSHVIFILATTEAHKLPETIISRTQHFSFKTIDNEKAIIYLQELAKKESITIDEPALRLLVEHGGGSFRDSIGLLDQVGHSMGKITRKDVEQLLGVAPSKAIEELLQATLTGTPSSVAASLMLLTEQGIVPQQVAKQLASAVRNQILQGRKTIELAELLETLLDVQISHNPLAALELSLFKSNIRQAVIISPAPSAPLKPTAEVSTLETLPVDKNTRSVEIQKEELKKVKDLTNGPLKTWWPELLMEIKKHNNTLYGVMRMAQPDLDGDKLNLSFKFGFHAKKISDTATKMKIESIIAVLTNQPISLEVSHNKNALSPVEPEPGQVLSEAADNLQAELEDNNDLQAITSVFGGGEVLET